LPKAVRTGVSPFKDTNTMAVGKGTRDEANDPSKVALCGIEGRLDIEEHFIHFSRLNHEYLRFAQPIVRVLYIRATFHV